MKTQSKRNNTIDPLKRLGIAALLAVGLTLFAKPPPQGEDWGAIQLVNTGAEPRAWGVATLNNVTTGLLTGYDSSRLWVNYHATLTVECQNLTPGARYSTPAGTFKADRRGRGKATGDVSFVIVWEISWWGSSTMILGDLLTPYEVEVVRLDPSGSTIPVLSCSFVPPE
jgi:hypothetical protein